MHASDNRFARCKPHMKCKHFSFEAEQARLQEKIHVKATTLQTTTQDHAHDIGKMLASLRTKHKDEPKKALDA